MARKKADSKKKPVELEETSQSIAAQTAAFLQNGGKVQVIERGISGQENVAGRKHITYSKS